MRRFALLGLLIPSVATAARQEIALPRAPSSPAIEVVPVVSAAIEAATAVSDGPSAQPPATVPPSPLAAAAPAVIAAEAGDGLPVPAVSAVEELSPSDERLPTFLYRIVSPFPRFDGDGFLLAHASRFEEEPAAAPFNPRSVPLASERDWETVARTQFFQAPFGGMFQLLKIKTDRIQSLARREHGLLADAEYFGHVHRGAIAESRHFVWAFDQAPPKIPDSILKAWGSWLFFSGSRGHSPTPLE